MTEKLIELITADNIKLHGMLFSPPKKSNKTVVHVHGLADSFYQSPFFIPLAEMYTQKGYNFLTFNNRGAGYAGRIMQNDKEIKAGAYCEKFSESELDINCAIDYVKGLGTKEIILEGHSLGCSKVIHYYSKNKLPEITRLILLAPSDGIMKIKQILKDGYDDFMKNAEELIDKGLGDHVLVHQKLFPTAFTAKNFVTNYTPNSALDIFRYRDESFINKELLSIKIPILIEIGTTDTLAFISPNDDITPFFKRNLTANYRLDFITDANHHYLNKEKELADNINKWLE